MDRGTPWARNKADWKGNPAHNPENRLTIREMTKHFTVDEKSCQCAYSTVDNARGRCSEKKVHRGGSREVCAGMIEVIASIPEGKVEYRKDVANEVACLAVKARKEVPKDVKKALPDGHVVARKDTSFKSVTPNVASGKDWDRYQEILKELGYDIRANTRVPWKAFAILKEEIRVAKCEESGKAPGPPPVDPNALSESEDEDDEAEDEEVQKKAAAGKRRKKGKGAKGAKWSTPSVKINTLGGKSDGSKPPPVPVGASPAQAQGSAGVTHQVPTEWAVKNQQAQFQAALDQQAAELEKLKTEKEMKEKKGWFW